MRYRLLKRLRTKIKRNANIRINDPFNIVLYTELCGIEYCTPSHTILGFKFGAEKIEKELEHIALLGYVKYQRKKKGGEE